MSQQTTIRKLAELVNTPVEKLLEQLAGAGMKFSGPDQVVTSSEKVKLLGFLRRSHGKPEQAPEETDQSAKKITLNRRKQQEVTVNSGRSKTTVNVEVRQKRTYVKDGARAMTPDEERADILRKLEESRAQPRRTAGPGRRIVCATKPSSVPVRKRLPPRSARPRRRRPRKLRLPPRLPRHWLPASPSALRSTKPRRARRAGCRPGCAARAAVAAAQRRPQQPRAQRGVAGDRFAGQMHLSAPTARVVATATTATPWSSGWRNHGGRRDMSRGGNNAGPHAFERPTAPVVREVAIGETITVADLAQKLALKGGEVVKALFKMGVMATITQSIDHDTAALVTEELGHKADPCQRQRRRRRTAGSTGENGRSHPASAGGHHHGSRRPRQDLAAGLHPPHQGRHRRSRRHHPAHRCLPRGYAGA
jgi:translation initiation factor IF-2